MSKNRRKSGNDKNVEAKRDNVTNPSMESAIIAFDERKILPEGKIIKTNVKAEPEDTDPDRPASKTVKSAEKIYNNLHLVESDLKNVVKNMDAELEIVNATVVITAASQSLVKNASAAVWRKIGEFRKVGILTCLPKVETKIS